MDNFHEHVEQIEDMTRSFIEQSFQKLRSAEGAFELVENFRTIQSRESINQQINDRYKDILQQYRKELEAIHGIFDAHKARPPLYKNFPPVAGAVAWARDLYQRAKKPILRFKARDGLLATDYGEKVKQRYLAFARAVDAYVTSLYKEWQAHVQQVATEKLKQPILAAAKVDEAADRDRDDGEPAAEKATAPKKKARPTKFKMPAPPYAVNFVAELSLIIRESKYLDRMGFAIPDAALNVTLQEDKYHGYRQNLQLKLWKYDSLLASLAPVENELLVRQLAQLQRVLKTGFTPLNWNSQRIPFFIEACDKALNEFQGIVSQIQKSSAMIEEVVSAISNTVLAQPADLKCDARTGRPLLTDIVEFYEAMETKRIARLQNLVQKYRSIEPLLKKVEEVVASTATAASLLLAGYYNLWEKRICNAITLMIAKSLAGFQEMLRHADCTPFIMIRCTLSGKDVVVSPPPADVHKYFTKAVRNIVESAKVFVRWKRGTCVECEPQIVHEDEEPFVFSFHQDVGRNPHVVTLQNGLAGALQRLTAAGGKIGAYLASWKVYDVEHRLWDQKARLKLEKLKDDPPGFVFFDAKLARYARLAELAASQPQEEVIDFLRVDATAVAGAVAAQALAWRDDYGLVLQQASKKAMDALVDKWNAWEADISTNPEDLEALKFVLNAIAAIVDASMDMELRHVGRAESGHGGLQP